MSQPSRRRFLFWGIYLLFLVLLAEGTARLIFAVPALDRRLDASDNFAWRRNWVANHKSGKQMYFSFDSFDTSRGWRTRANIKNASVFDGKTLNTNAYGFRGAREVALEKDTTKTRILLLGDSFTFGENVSDDEAYAEVMQKALPKAEVINAGVHGYAHDQMLVMLREQLRFHPDVVMLGYLPADIPRNLLAFRDYAKPSYTLDENGKLQLHGIPVPPPDATLHMDWVRPRLIDLASALKFRLEKPAAQNVRAETLSAAILREMVRVADSAGAVPVFVYLPEGKELVAPRDSTPKEIWFRKQCREIGKVHCFSVWPAFKEQIEKGVVFKTGHWDPVGHRVAGEEMARVLLDSGIVRR
jgi:hypothetical protein